MDCWHVVLVCFSPGRTARLTYASFDWMLQFESVQRGCQGCPSRLSFAPVGIRRRPVPGEPERFLLIEKQGHPAFPPTKLRPGEDLFHALVRLIPQFLKTLVAVVNDHVKLPELDRFPEIRDATPQPLD